MLYRLLGELLLSTSPVDNSVMQLHLSLDTQLLIVFNERDKNEIDFIYHCGTTRQYCYLGCFKMKEPLVTVMDNHEFKVNQSDIIKIGNESMLIDVVSYESKMNTLRKSPGCQEFEDNDTNPESISGTIRKWLDYMSNRDFDPFWVKNCDEEIAQPFVKNDSKVDINIPYMNDKKEYNYGNVKIYSQNIKLIFRGNLKNGKIEDAIYVPSGN